jgi:hypothetical protein
MHLRRDVRTLYDQNKPRQDLSHLSVQFSLHQNLGDATSQEASFSSSGKSKGAEPVLLQSFLHAEDTNVAARFEQNSLHGR